MHRLTRVLLQNESFHIVAKDVSSGSTFNCHRSTWVAETHLVDVALLVLRDNQNIEKTTEEVTSLVDEVHFMRKLQQHPNILHCYGLLFMGSSSTDPMQMNLRTNNIDNIIDNKIDTTTTTTAAAAAAAAATTTTTTTISTNNNNMDNNVDNTNNTISNVINNPESVTIEMVETKEKDGTSTKINTSRSSGSLRSSRSSSSTLPIVVPLDKSPFSHFIQATTGALASVALVLEWCEHGSLNHVLQEKGKYLTLIQRLQMTSGVAHAVWCLHSQDIPFAHPDLTSSNIYITIDFHIKLGGCFPRLSQYTKHRNDVRKLQKNILSLANIMRKLLGVGNGGEKKTEKSTVVPICLNKLILSMEDKDPSFRPTIDEVVRQVDAAIVDLETRMLVVKKRIHL